MKNRFLFPVFIAVLLSLLMAAGLPEPADAAATGFFKEGNKWYYMKNGEVITDTVRKIDGKYYAFGASGAMKTGFRKFGGCIYYFKKEADGKAPALTDCTADVKGTTYYFSSKGRGFLSLGLASADQAAAMVYDLAEFSAGMTKKEKLRALFDAETEACRYVGVRAPDFSDPDWYGKSALEMISKGRGKCYNWAALTYVIARSLGYKAKIASGYVDENAPDNIHAWVVVKGRYLLEASFYDRTQKEIWFFHTFEEVLEEEGKPYTELKQLV